MALRGDAASLTLGCFVRRLQRQIAATDRQIDELACELYSLSDEEVRTPEEATAR